MTDSEIKRRADGSIDTGFYIARSRALRAGAIRAAWREAWHRLTHRFACSRAPISGSSGLPLRGALTHPPRSLGLRPEGLSRHGRSDD